MNKVVISFDRVSNGITQQYRQNATIDIKEKQRKKGNKLSFRSSPAARRTCFCVLHINKVQGARRESAIFIVQNGEYHQDCYLSLLMVW